MESYPSVSSSSSSSHLESESSTQRKRGRNGKNNPKSPLYQRYDELSNMDIPQKEKDSIKKSKRCKDYRECKKEQELLTLKENAMLKEQLQQKIQEAQCHEQTISQQAWVIQQKNAAIEFQRLCIVEKEREIGRKEQENREKSAMIQAQHQRIGFLIDLVEKLQSQQNQQSAVLNIGPASMPMEQAENTLDVGNGQDGQAWIYESFLPADNFHLERSDQSTLMLDRLEQDLEPKPESSIMQEMRTLPLDDLEHELPDIDLLDTDDMSSLFD